MKIKHKVKRKLDPTFQAELKLCSLCGPTLGGNEWSVRGLGIGPGADCQVHICLGDASEGQSWCGRQRVWPQQAALCCSLTPGPIGRDAGGVSGSSGSGAEHPAPCLQGPPQKSPQASGSPQLLSESCVHSTCLRASFGFLFYLRLLCPRLRIRETSE